VEQAVRLLILWILLAYGIIAVLPHFWIAAALLAVGEGVSLAALVLGYRRGLHPVGSRRVPRRDVLTLALPVMSGRLLSSLTGVVEAVLIPLQLRRSGLTEATAVGFFGKLTGMALPLILFPTALTVSLATNLVPAVARAKAEADTQLVQRLLDESFRATAYLTVPVTVILLVLGRPLDDYVFHTRLSAGVFLPLVLGAFFLYFDITQSGVLRGLGYTAVPLQNDLWASLFELAVIGAVGARPGFGRETIAGAVAMGFCVSWALNLRDTVRLTGYRLRLRRLVAKPLVASVPLLVFIPWWIQVPLVHHLGRGLDLASGVVAGSALYLAGLKVTGARWSQLI
jgi:stage V sporulation protein B